MKKIIITILTLGFAAQVFAAAADDPLLAKVMINKLESRDAKGSNPLALRAEGWIGKDLDKFWFKTEAMRVAGVTDDAEMQFLYSRALAPYWDVQIGVRTNVKPQPERNYLAVGLKGLAPYLFELDATLFIGKAGQVSARIDAEYEYMLTQQWILSPELEMNFYSKTDAAAAIGSGLATMSSGLRLRYEIAREFAPYIGLHWSKKFGRTGDFVREEGGTVSDTQFVVGLRAWF